MPSPPASGPSLLAATAWALLVASRTAATIRSAKVSVSLGSTASGLDLQTHAARRRR